MDDQSAQSDTEKPPQGDYQKAEEYVSKLAKLISLDKLHVVKTDLQKFDPTSLQNHYRIDLTDYNIEVSHSKDSNSGKDSYIMIFTNVSKINAGSLNQKVILAYLHLTQNQYQRFTEEADDQLEKIRKLEEEKRFTEAAEPIEKILDNLEQTGTSTHSLPENAATLQSDEEHTLKEYDINPLNDPFHPAQS